jgi:hypothetical protein
MSVSVSETSKERADRRCDSVFATSALRACPGLRSKDRGKPGRREHLSNESVAKVRSMRSNGLLASNRRSKGAYA